MPIDRATHLGANAKAIGRVAHGSASNEIDMLSCLITLYQSAVLLSQLSLFMRATIQLCFVGEFTDERGCQDSWDSSVSRSFDGQLILFNSHVNT